MKCNHIEQGPMRRVCAVCGHVAYTNAPISRECPGELKPMPSLVQRAANAAGAVVSAVADGFTAVSTEQQAARLAVCETCEAFDGDSCRECGCRASWKARLRAWNCPLKKWPTITT